MELHPPIEADKGTAVLALADGAASVLYVGDDHDAFHCLGGNQSDRVCVTRIAKSRLYTARRPLYRVQPANVRSIHLDTAGALSLNEA